MIAGWSVSSRFVMALALVGRLMDGFLMREILEIAADKVISYTENRLNKDVA